jgi:DNA-binding CsgD family transcriptional regulator
MANLVAVDGTGTSATGSPLAELLHERVDQVLSACRREPSVSEASPAAVEGFISALEALEHAADVLSGRAHQASSKPPVSPSWDEVDAARSYGHLAGLLPRSLERAVKFDAAAAVVLLPRGEIIVDALGPPESRLGEVVRERALQLQHVLCGGIESAVHVLPPRPPEIASALYVPLVALGGVVGVTYIASRRAEAFSEADAAMMADLAAHAGGAFQRLDAAVRGVRATPRQSQVLSLIAAGLSDKEIAARLGMSPRTVRTHLERILRQHGLSSRTEAATAWLRGERR